MLDLREIPGEPGYYASPEGDIYSSRRGQMRKLKPGVARVRNYVRHQVALGRGHTRKVSRLIAVTFLGDPPSPDSEVAHLNGNSLDNRASNLAWKSKTENEADKVAHGTTNRGSRQWQARLTDDDIREIRRLWATGLYRQKDLAAQFGIRQPHISEIVNRKKWAWLD